MKGYSRFASMRPTSMHPEHLASRHFLLQKIPEGADRFGNWDNVEFDKNTGKAKRVKRANSRPQRANRRDRLVITDPDGEGASRFGDWDRLFFNKSTGMMSRRPKRTGDEKIISDAEDGEAGQALI